MKIYKFVPRKTFCYVGLKKGINLLMKKNSILGSLQSVEERNDDGMYTDIVEKCGSNIKIPFILLA